MAQHESQSLTPGRGPSFLAQPLPNSSDVAAIDNRSLMHSRCAAKGGQVPAPQRADPIIEGPALKRSRCFQGPWEDPAWGLERFPLLQEAARNQGPIAQPTNPI